MFLTVALVCWSVFGGGQQLAQSWEIDKARAYRIHSNAGVFEVSGPRARERAHGGFGCTVHAPRWECFAGYDGRIEDDGSTVGQRGQRLLHCKK
jgi:hypothetical protein